MNRKVIMLLLLIAAAVPIDLLAINKCMCGSYAGGTTITYWTEGGCCSGILAAPGGVIDTWTPSGDGTYELSDSNPTSAASAQSQCCD